MERIARQQAGIEGLHAAALICLACTYVVHAAIRAMAARATPKTLARKRSKGYAAPRDDEDEDDDVIFVKEIGAHTADLLFLWVYPLTVSRGSLREAQAIAGLGGSAALQGVSTHQIFCRT